MATPQISRETSAECYYTLKEARVINTLQL
jgi:hypothetical protein